MARVFFVVPTAARRVTAAVIAPFACAVLGERDVIGAHHDLVFTGFTTARAIQSLASFAHGRQTEADFFADQIDHNAD